MCHHPLSSCSNRLHVLTALLFFDLLLIISCRRNAHASCWEPFSACTLFVNCCWYNCASNCQQLLSPWQDRTCHLLNICCCQSDTWEKVQILHVWWFIAGHWSTFGDIGVQWKWSIPNQAKSHNRHHYHRHNHHHTIVIIICHSK